MTFPEVETTFAWVESVMNRVKIPPTLCRSYFTKFSVASYKHSARFAHLYVSIAILGTKHAFPVSISMLNQEQLFGIKLLQETCFGAFKSTIETSTVLNSSLTLNYSEHFRADQPRPKFLSNHRFEVTKQTGIPPPRGWGGGGGGGVGSSKLLIFVHANVLKNLYFQNFPLRGLYTPQTPARLKFKF